MRVMISVPWARAAWRCAAADRMVCREAEEASAAVAADEAARVLEQTEPMLGVLDDPTDETSNYTGHGRLSDWIAQETLADSLRAFDAMTIDDLAALQTAR
jgi:hypothetical protein